VFFQTVCASLIALLLGEALAFPGYRLFVILLPIWAFFGGLTTTASALAGLWGTGFLTTILTWVTSLLIGILCSLLAYLFYYAAIVLLIAMLGYQIGVGFMTLLGFRLGALSVLVGVAIGLILALIAWFLRVPKIAVIVFTALAGAAALLADVFLALGVIQLGDLQGGVVGAVVRQSWYGTLFYLALTIVGIGVQWRFTATSYIVDAYTRELALA